jgi:hypothetical protein
VSEFSDQADRSARLQVADIRATHSVIRVKMVPERQQ